MPEKKFFGEKKKSLVSPGTRQYPNSVKKKISAKKCTFYIWKMSANFQKWPGMEKCDFRKLRNRRVTCPAPFLTIPAACYGPMCIGPRAMAAFGRHCTGASQRPSAAGLRTTSGSLTRSLLSKIIMRWMYRWKKKNDGWNYD